MGFFKKIIGLRIAETACNAVNSKINTKKAEREKKRLEALEQLKKLYDTGAITEKEYKRKKKELLAKY